MGRIVVNKHSGIKSDITPESFVNTGEIIISNQKGFEGIFIKNNVGEIFFISPTEGTGTEVPIEFKEYIETFINGRLIGYVTKEEFNELAKDIQIDPEQVKEIVEGELKSYSTTEEMNKAIEDAISNIEFPSTDGLATETFVMEKIAEAKLEGEDVNLDIFVTEEELNEKGFLTEIPEQSIRDIAVEEVLKIVDSADTSYDTLREIAYWIKNDPTGAAGMSNDIAALKSISADTRLATIEGISADTRLAAIESVSADTRLDSIEAVSADTRLGDIENKLTGLTADDIYDAEQGRKQSEINQLLLQGSEESSKHFFMSTTQYAELVKNGSVTIDEKEFIYDENAYYALYEPDEEE